MVDKARTAFPSRSTSCFRSIRHCHKTSSGWCAIIIKPNIERLDNGKVRFVDGTASRADLLIYATGYRISFPFLPDEVLRVKDNVIPLYRKVIHPERSGLYFMGLIQPLGAIMPLVELQAEWVARILQGAPLPAPAAMHAAIADDQEALRRRYVNVPRHTLQVDYFPYKRLMEREVAKADHALGRSPPPVLA